MCGPPSGRTARSSREFLILAPSTTLYFIGMGASNPLMPKFVVDELGGSEATAGIVMGSFAVAALATRSPFGRLGDRRGSRRLMLIGCALVAVGMLVLTVTEHVPMAIGARLILGAAQAAVMTGATDAGDRHVARVATRRGGQLHPRVVPHGSRPRAGDG